MTKFHKLPNSKIVESKTEFTHVILASLDTVKTHNTPNDFDNVMWLGEYSSGIDVFKCWDDRNPEEFSIYFGTKGDEFNT